MFLVDRLPSPTGLRAELAPRQLFGGAGDLIRAALMARPPVADAGPPQARHRTAQLDLALPQPARRRKAG
jgi:hypothetical protein